MGNNNRTLSIFRRKLHSHVIALAVDNRKEERNLLFLIDDEMYLSQFLIDRASCCPYNLLKRRYDMKQS